jgi:anti-anti-sigma regulatory factor
MQAAKPYLEACVERGVLVLTLIREQIEGEDAALALKEEMLAVVAHHAIYRVALDFRHTRYVSSIAFWPLLALKRELAEHGGRLLVCGLTGAVHDIFTTTKMVSSAGSLNAPFEMAPDREAAVALLAEDATNQTP